jgi:hypothetical protein
VRDRFVAGAADPSTPSFSRCPRHLHQTCEICINPGSGVPTRPRGVSRASDRVPVAQGGGISGFAEGAGVGSGLARLGPGGTLLRRVVPPLDEMHIAGPESGTGAGNTRLAELIPRFLRLSALVALELGREVGVGVGAEEVGPNSRRAALAPTAQWYFLLAGLLTRAVLEGYLTAGWTGLGPLQVLLGVGLGSPAPPDAAAPAVDDKYVEFEPDGMPDLSDAVDVLFPSRSTNAGVGGEIGYENVGDVGGGGNGSSGGGTPGGEAEYAREMGQRLARVCNRLSFPGASIPVYSVTLLCAPRAYPSS